MRFLNDVLPNAPADPIVKDNYRGLAELYDIEPVGSFDEDHARASGCWRRAESGDWYEPTIGELQCIDLRSAIDVLWRIGAEFVPRK